MGYDIHIERSPAFTLDEWKVAVRATPGVRLDDSGSAAVNPRTGVRIFVPGVDGDAQIDFEEGWLPCFHWQSAGSVVFRAAAEFDDGNSRLRQIVRDLATRLNAVIRGDGGECYD